jgi:hypothetical protein
MLVDGFRDPEAAFAAAEGLKRCETVVLWHGPRKAQGAAAAGASGISEGNVVRRLHRDIPPRRPLCLMALPARSPTGLGLTLPSPQS